MLLLIWSTFPRTVMHVETEYLSRYSG
jgi:hypothetical protein